MNAFFLRIFCWVIGAGLMLGLPFPCSAQDTGLISPILSLSENTAVLPMNISFYGTGRHASAASAAERADGLSQGAAGPSAATPGQTNPFARIHAYLLKYVTVGATSDLPEAGTASPDVDMARGRADQPMSLEFQAGLGDKSGALFFVMKL